MLKVMLKIALIILLALVFAELGREDPGYVLINFQGYVIETSLLVILVTGIVIAMATSLTLYLVRPFWNRIKPISTNPKLEKNYLAFNQGMLALSDGDWTLAEKRLSRLNSGPVALIAQLGAARAAYELGREPKAMAFLEQAQKIDAKQGGKNKHHLHLADCQFAIAKTDYPAAMKALNKISANQHNKVYWKLKAQVLEQTQQWHQLYAMLPKLRQDKLFSDSKLLEIEAQCLATLLHDQSLEAIQEFWKALPSKRRSLSELAEVKFDALLEIGETQLAYDIAVEQVQRGINSAWAPKLAKLTEFDWQTRYNLLTKYMGNNASDTLVIKALGTIAHQGGQDETALSHFRQALALEPKDLPTQLLVFKMEKKDESCPEQQLDIIAKSVATM